MQSMRALLGLVLMLGLLPVFAADAPPIKVLIVDGASNHDWRLTTRSIRAIIEPTGLFTVTVATAPPATDAAAFAAWRPDFAAAQVIIQQYNNGPSGPLWPAAVRADLERFVSQGGGMYVWHAGNNAFAGWPEYSRMIGLGWRSPAQGTALVLDDAGAIRRIPPGEGSGTSHGKRFDALITRLGDHPIHAGLPRRWRAADIEVYSFPRGPAEGIEVLSWATDLVRTKQNWPIEWTVTYGQGRVYTSTLGHVWPGDVDPVTVRDAGVQTLLVRALQWLARRPVTWPVPVDFPGEDHPVVRPPLGLP
jgi:hypothetical protein